VEKKNTIFRRERKVGGGHQKEKSGGGGALNPRVRIGVVCPAGKKKEKPGPGEKLFHGRLATSSKSNTDREASDCETKTIGSKIYSPEKRNM